MPDCVDLLLTDTGQLWTRRLLRVVGWALAALFMGMLWVLSTRYVRSVLPYYGRPFSTPWLIHITIGAWLLANVLGNYIWCVITDPGSAGAALALVSASGDATLDSGRDVQSQFENGSESNVESGHGRSPVASFNYHHDTCTSQPLFFRFPLTSSIFTAMTGHQFA